VYPSFNDSGWPDARIYQASQVTNQASYVNFATSAWGNADFIWSSNLILDNVVLTRKTVAPIISAIPSVENPFRFSAILSNDRIIITAEEDMTDSEILLFDSAGRKVDVWKGQHLVRGSSISLPLNHEVAGDRFFILTVNSGSVSRSIKITNSEK
jgi:hypothetical protein